MPGVVIAFVNPSYAGGIGRRITIHGQPRKKKQETLSEK
jgi:hypothetical protein